MYKLICDYSYTSVRVYPPTSSERRACETTAKPCLSKSKPKQQGISPSSPGRPRPPAAQARMTHACSSRGWMVQDLINIFFFRGHSSLQSGATGVHRGFLDADLEPPSPPPLALKLALPPARECQIAHLTGIRASRHPGINASGPRGRRQRR